MDNEGSCVPHRLCRISEDAERLSPQLYTGVRLAGSVKAGSQGSRGGGSRLFFTGGLHRIFVGWGEGGVCDGGKRTQRFYQGHATAIYQIICWRSRCDINTPRISKRYTCSSLFYSTAWRDRYDVTFTCVFWELCKA